MLKAELRRTEEKLDSVYKTIAVKENKNQMKIDHLQREVRELRARGAERREFLAALHDLREGKLDISLSEFQPTGNKERDEIARAGLEFLFGEDLG